MFSVGFAIRNIYIFIELALLRVFSFEVHLTTNQSRFRWWEMKSTVTQSPKLQWRHNEHDSVSNHQPHDCLLNRISRRRSKKTSKLRVTGLCVGNSPVTGEFPAQKASNAENVSIWWRHHNLRWKDSPLTTESTDGQIASLHLLCIWQTLCYRRHFYTEPAVHKMISQRLLYMCHWSSGFWVWGFVMIMEFVTSWSIVPFTETGMLLFWWNIHHRCLHWKLSKWRCFDSNENIWISIWVQTGVCS